MLLLLTEGEGGFERPKALMERWQLPQWGQLRTVEAHHVHRWVTEEQRPQSFADEALDGPISTKRSRGHSHLLLRRLTDLSALPSHQSVLGVGAGLGTSCAQSHL